MKDQTQQINLTSGVSRMLILVSSRISPKAILETNAKTVSVNAQSTVLVSAGHRRLQISRIHRQIRFPRHGTDDVDLHTTNISRPRILNFSGGWRRICHPLRQTCFRVRRAAASKHACSANSRWGFSPWSDSCRFLTRFTSTKFSHLSASRRVVPSTQFHNSS
jgi:hypothetical protein